MSPVTVQILEAYKSWAPADSVWSQWAKPALFTCAQPQLPQLAPLDLPAISFNIENPQNTVVVVDLPRAEAIRYGLLLGRQGFRPVPLFNCVNGPSPVLELGPMLDLLAASAEELASWRLPANAPPVFLLDSRRMIPEKKLAPGNFDNRYLIFPQDFPSAGFLKSHGIERVVLIKETQEGVPKEDLAHVLLRWQESGLKMFAIGLNQPAETKPLQVAVPRRFRSLFYRVLALAGLHRNSAGGFGAVIPQPSSGG